jgi:hypothetical protein
MSTKLQSLLNEAGVASVNTPAWTPNHPHFKGVVVAYFRKFRGGRPEAMLIRFGNWEHPNNQSPEARADHWQRNSKAVSRGLRSMAYWEWWYLWAPGTKSWKPGDPKPSGLMFKGKKV